MKIQPSLRWAEIETVLLDMDGTLLDLYFDNQFWLTLLPAKVAEKQGITHQKAVAKMRAHYESVMGTISWYCLDYWEAELGIDIMQAKRELIHLIRMREDTLPFLNALHQSGREVILLTNAHPKSLALKVGHTGLDQHISTLISTHVFGATKESQILWQRLHQQLGFDRQKTLFVDDGVTILQAAKTFGIGHLLGVANPDSTLPAKPIEQFASVQDYKFLIDDILANPVKS